MYLRFVPTALSVLQLGECVVQAPEPGIRLAGIRFGFSGVRRWSRKKITRWVSSAYRISAIVALGSFRARSTPLTSAPSAPAIGATEMVSQATEDLPEGVFIQTEAVDRQLSGSRSAWGYGRYLGSSEQGKIQF